MFGAMIRATIAVPNAHSVRLILLAYSRASAANKRLGNEAVICS